jgi:hypothetical protein
MKYTPWSSRLRVGRGDKNRTPEIIYYYETSRAYGGRYDPYRATAPVKKNMLRR